MSILLKIIIKFIEFFTYTAMTTLEIRVRCVSSFQPDLLVTLSIDNTVLQLKQEISKFHPAHPVFYILFKY